MAYRMHNKSFAERFFNSPITAMALPPVLWILAWLLQQRLNITIDIEHNQNVLQFTTGVRLFCGLIFGIWGLASLTVGSILWFAFTTSDQYTLPFETLSVLTIVYSVVIYLAIQFIEKIRSYDENYSQFRNADLLALVISTAAVNTFIKLSLIPSTMNQNFIDVFALQFAGRFIGGMLTLYVLMGLVDLVLSQQRIDHDQH